MNHAANKPAFLFHLLVCRKTKAIHPKMKAFLQVHTGNNRHAMFNSHELIQLNV
jgi:hypothetical protein